MQRLRPPDKTAIVSISMPPAMAADIRREAHKFQTSLSRYVRLLFLNSIGKGEAIDIKLRRP